MRPPNERARRACSARLVAVVTHPEAHIARAIREVVHLDVARADIAAFVVPVREDALTVEVQIADAGDGDAQGTVILLLQLHEVLPGVAAFFARPRTGLAALGVGLGAHREDPVHVGVDLGGRVHVDRERNGGVRPQVAVGVGVEVEAVDQVVDLIGEVAAELARREERFRREAEAHGVVALLELRELVVARLVGAHEIAVDVEDVGHAGLFAVVDEHVAVQVADFRGGGAGITGVVGVAGVRPLGIGVAAHEGRREEDHHHGCSVWAAHSTPLIRQNCRIWGWGWCKRPCFGVPKDT